jgi:hypothetical protein
MVNASAVANSPVTSIAQTTDGRHWTCGFSIHHNSDHDHTADVAICVTDSSSKLTVPE